MNTVSRMVHSGRLPMEELQTMLQGGDNAGPPQTEQRKVSIELTEQQRAQLQIVRGAILSQELLRVEVEALLLDDERTSGQNEKIGYKALLDGQRAGPEVAGALQGLRAMVGEHGEQGKSIMPSLMQLLRVDRNLECLAADLGCEAKRTAWGKRLGRLSVSRSADHPEGQWHGLFGLYDTFLHFCGSKVDAVTKEPLLTRTRFVTMYKAMLQTQQQKPLSETEVQRATADAGIVYSQCRAKPNGLLFVEVRQHALPKIAQKHQLPVKKVEQWMELCGRPALEATSWLGQVASNPGLYGTVRRADGKVFGSQAKRMQPRR